MPRRFAPRNDGERSNRKAYAAALVLRSDWDQIEKFSEYVFNAGYSSPVRTPRGRDILAACGQLKSESEKVRASARRKLVPAPSPAP